MGSKCDIGCLNFYMKVFLKGSVAFRGFVFVVVVQGVVVGM
jgi:hypothetical protein